MAFTYDDGSGSPSLVGMVGCPDGTHINDGTFKSSALSFFTDTPPVIEAVSDLPSDHGGMAGTPFYQPRRGNLEGWLWLPSPMTADDVPAAEARLKSAFALPWDGSLQTFTIMRRGWSEARQVQARVNGQITIARPGKNLAKIAQRDFLVPLVAPDPFVYSTTVHSVNLEYAATLHGIANAGDVRTWLKIRFNGPVTNPALVYNLTNRKIVYTGTIASGHYVEIDTNPTYGPTALDDTGANVIGNVSQFDLRTIPSGGTQNFHAEGSGYTTNTATLTYRDAYTAA